VSGDIYDISVHHILHNFEVEFPSLPARQERVLANNTDELEKTQLFGQLIKSRPTNINFIKVSNEYYSFIFTYSFRI
tara:strand:+ start:1993 stop:2223 length:231 start_codon:yes stop_codon:yes gene_type:complete